jgi:Mlc titration factor MtfA (ptsG expression regulator)
MYNTIGLIFITIIVTGLLIWLKSSRDKKKLMQEKMNEKFPDAWREILLRKIAFYKKLNVADRALFEKRIHRFLATKNIEGVDTEIDDMIRLMVASSAVIPTFAFPDYNYPNVHTVLIYPNSFDEHFQTQRFAGHKQDILGMVGNRFMTGTVILSKPDLIKAFDGLPHKENVGIHEFVHLLDKEDGAVDGIPEELLAHKYIGPWLHEIKNEIKRIESGKSDINPYALTNNAEFLAVVSEYFFENPDKFKSKHSELYEFLSNIYNTKTLEH